MAKKIEILRNEKKVKVIISKLTVEDMELIEKYQRFGYEIIDIVPPKKEKNTKSPYSKEKVISFLNSISDEETDKNGFKIKEKFKAVQKEKPNQRKDGKETTRKEKGFIAGLSYFKSCYKYDEKEKTYIKK